MIASKRLQQRTLVFIRWLAIAGQLGAVIFVAFVLGYDFPWVWCFGAVFALAVINIVAGATNPRPFLGDYAAGAYLSFDMIELSFLLYLTGGINNPFAMLILAPITVSATMLSRTVTIFLIGLGFALIIFLSFFHYPLPLGQEMAKLPIIYSWGQLTALCLSLVFIASYLAIVSADSQKLSGAVFEMQKLLDQQGRISALGAQAAAAAHALGTPLATISIVAKELQQEPQNTKQWKQDIELLQTETKRCQNILASLGQGLKMQPFGASEDTFLDGSFSQLPLPSLIELAAEPYIREDIDWSIKTKLPTNAIPKLFPKAEILHGFGNLLQNAFQFARSTVQVLIDHDQHNYLVIIQDDGPGFTTEILDRLGEPYISTGAQNRSPAGGTNHMGLGIFIAQTTLATLPARIIFENQRNGGGQVTVIWAKKG